MRRSTYGLICVLVGCGPNVVQWPLDPPALEVTRDVVSFGSLHAEERAIEWVTVRNVGQVPMGFVPSLVSDDSPSLGDVGAFLLLAGCEDVLHTGERGCLLGPGERHNLQLTYSPTADGPQGDAVLLRTVGDQRVPEVQDLPDEERHFIDPEQPRSLVFLTGEGVLGDATLHLSSRRVHLGWPGPEQRVRSEVMLSNRGRTDLLVRGVRPQTQCDPAFGLPEIKDVTVPAQGNLWLDFSYDATRSAPGPARCAVQVEVSSGFNDPQYHKINVEVAVGVRPLNRPPRILLLEPQTAQVVLPGDELEFRINVRDPDDVLSSLSCGVVTSRPETLTTLVRCPSAYPNGDVRLTVLIPKYFRGDVLRAYVRDRQGAWAEATIPVAVPQSRAVDDADNDTFSVSDGDCDDGDPTVYPMAAELLDGKDNDCDSRVDEDTVAGDDDGDGVSEQAGDCDDADADIYPGAPEALNYKDDNCNGVIDEGTAIWDDDGDGWARTDGDCDDSDPNVYPGAVEWCGNQADDDCDGIRDRYDLQGCREPQQDPRFFGGVDLSRSAAETGDSVRACVMVHDPDGDEVQVQWSASRGGTMPMPVGTCADWLLPDEVDGPYERLWIYATAVDGRGGSAQARAELWLLPDGGLDVVLVREEEPIAGSCEGAPGVASWLWLALPWMLRRRRRA